MATGDITAIVIRADGFSADVTIEGWSAKSVASYDEGSLPASGNMALTVTSEGYNTSGTLGTVARTVNGTLVMRQAYPNEASFDETVSGSDLVVRIAFDNHIYDDDSNGGAGTSGTDPVAVITSGYITAGDASVTNAHAGLTCTNNSTLDYPKVIGQWDWQTTPFYKRVNATFNMAFRARHGFGVAAVYLQALGASSANDINSHATAVTKQTAQNSLCHESYQQSVAITGFTQAENITLKAIAYPVVGDANSIIDTSTNTTATDRIRGVTEITCTCDKTDALKDYAVVTTTGNDGTGVNSTTLATAEASPFLTIGKAMASGATIVYVRTGTHDILGADPVTVTVRDYWLEIRPHPSDAASGITLNRGGSFKPYTCTKLAYIGFTGDITGTSWIDGEAKNNTVLLFEGCSHNVASKPTVGLSYRSDGVWFVNCTGMGTDDFNDFSSSSIAYSFTGCSFSSVTEVDNWYSVIACDGSATMLSFLEKTASNPAPAQNSAMYEFNSFKGVTSTTQKILLIGENIAVESVSIVGNVLETKSISTSQASYIGGDNAAVAMNNVIFAHNTIAGDKTNFCYNDIGTSSVLRTNIWNVGNAIRSYNIKSDVFPTASGNRIGNWAQMNGVGYRDNVYDGAASASFVNDYDGLNVAYETAANTTFGQMGYVDDASTDGTTLGGGDYTPDTGSVLTGHTLTSPFITYDLNGNPINSEIGAIQILVVAVGSPGAFTKNILGSITSSIASNITN